MTALPTNLLTLFSEEDALRRKAMELISRDSQMILCIQLIERAMNLLDALRQASNDDSDDDHKVIVVLGLRSFNTLASTLRLAMSGYSQAAVLVLRDAMETAFLVELFGIDRTTIQMWRTADKKSHRKEFSPAQVRTTLNKHYGHTTKRRDEHYSLFSELAGHPSMAGIAMLRPDGRDARNGPFIEPGALKAVISEAGLIAILVGLSFSLFIPTGWSDGIRLRREFGILAQRWKVEVWAAP